MIRPIRATMRDKMYFSDVSKLVLRNNDNQNR